MHFDQLTRIEAPDFRPRDCVRLGDGTLVVAGQTGIYEADRRARPQTPTEAVFDGGAYVYGTRAPGPRPPQLTPTGLGIDDLSGGGTIYDVRDGEALLGQGDEIARVPSGADFGAISDFGGIGAVEVLANCATGARSMANYWTVPDGSYLLTARYAGLTQNYEWPGDWAAVTAQAVPPDWYSWRHPQLGIVQYDPVWGVGALPFNAGDPRQARLLDAREETVQKNRAKRHRAWDGKLIIFDEDGDQIGFDGEFSALRIVVGEDDWIGDVNVHPGATVGTALLKTGADGELLPWVVDPRLRAANALLLEEQTLWIGGMRATRNGREPVLIKVDTATGVVEFVASFKGDIERGADGWQNIGVTGIARGWDGVLRAWTPEARLRLRQFFGVWILKTDGEDEGRGETRGGWCPTIALSADGSSVEAVAIEHPHPWNEAALELRCGGSRSTWINGVKLSRLGPNVLAPWSGALWGVVSLGEGVQQLGYTTSGGWRAYNTLSERRKIRIVARCGRFLLMVGEERDQVNAGVFAPSAIMRLSKSVKPGAYSGHFDRAAFQIRSVHETLSLDGKRDAALFLAEDDEGFLVMESDGRTALEIESQRIADAEFQNARTAFERLNAVTPQGCALWALRVPFVGELSALGLAMGDEISHWVKTANEPTLWFAPDAALFPDEAGAGAPSAALLAQLETVTEWLPAWVHEAGGIYWPQRRPTQTGLLVIVAPVGMNVEVWTKAVDAMLRGATDFAGIEIAAQLPTSKIELLAGGDTELLAGVGVPILLARGTGGA